VGTAQFVVVLALIIHDDGPTIATPHLAILFAALVAAMVWTYAVSRKRRRC
jgi:ABC-type Fe3+-siderophore transport system permease subunit